MTVLTVAVAVAVAVAVTAVMADGGKYQISNDISMTCH
jgi:hypothetical protein